MSDPINDPSNAPLNDPMTDAKTDPTSSPQNEAPLAQSADPLPCSPEPKATLEDKPAQPTTANLNKEKDKDKVPATDVSLICDDNLTRSKDRAPQQKPPKTYAKRGYQLLLVVALIAAFLMAMVYQTLLGHLNRPAEDLIVDEGQSYYGLLPLYQNSVPMFSASLAKLYIKTYVKAPLQAGTYAMPANPTFKQMIAALQQEQKVETLVVQIIEGKTAGDLYQTLANTPGIKLEVLQADGTPKPNLKQALGIDATTPPGKYAENLEGWFTPNTYHYPKGASDKQVLTDLYHSQKQALDKAWANRAEDLPYASPYEALIMASIIEKETSVPSERAVVAAVFVNRLKKGIRLQTDPTIIYGIKERYDGNIRREDINEKTDYNTYQIDGLPPTPIALPSHASIEAAMHPADSDALYFVATGTGGHKFTTTLQAHNQAVQEYLKVIRAKE